MRVAIGSILATVGAASLAGVQSVENYTFEMFEMEFNRTYASAEERAMRREIFANNIEQIKNMNQGSEATYGITKFADLTTQEVSASFGKKQTAHKYGATLAKPSITASSIADLPKSVNWSAHATAIKEQGMCGSCWAMSASALLESYASIQHGVLAEVSPQQMVDCVPNPRHCGGEGGCEGSTEQLAWDYLKESGGAVLEADYPYEGEDGECRESKFGRKFTVESHHMLTPNSYEEIITHLATVGPLSVSVAADTWPYYLKGVHTKCPSKPEEDVVLNHGVVLMGYGTDEATGLDYWLIRNSWGSKWGENGFIRILRNKPTDENFCLTDSKPEDNSMCEDEEIEPMTVCGHCGMLKDAAFVVVGLADAEEAARI